MDEFDSALQPIASGELDVNVYQSIHDTLTRARTKVYATVNSVIVEAYWDIGR